MRSPTPKPLEPSPPPADPSLPPAPPPPGQPLPHPLGPEPATRLNKILVPYTALLPVILFMLLLLPWSALRRPAPWKQKDVPCVARGKPQRPLFATTDLIPVSASQLTQLLQQPLHPHHPQQPYQQ